MREVKFRAWDTYDNRMKHKFTIGSVTNSDNNLWTCPTLWLEDTGWVNCDTLVLMQYTGLKDKNGVEIYEGDIVAHIPKHECNYIIKYLSSGFYICPNNENYGEYFTSLFAGFDDKNKCNSIEVIGNIYEHQHLLGE